MSIVKAKKEDRRVRRTKRLVERALIDLIIKKGYEKITIQDLLEEADIGRSTFYAHYQDKQDLLMKTMERIMSDLAIDVSNSDVSQWGEIPIPSLTLFEHAQDNYRIYQALLGRNGYPVTKDLVRKNLTKHISESLEKQGAKPTGISLSLVAVWLTGSLQTLLEWWLENRMPHAPKEMDVMYRKLISGHVEKNFPELVLEQEVAFV